MAGTHGEEGLQTSAADRNTSSLTFPDCVGEASLLRMRVLMLKCQSGGPEKVTSKKWQHGLFSLQIE